MLIIKALLFTYSSNGYIIIIVHFFQAWSKMYFRNQISSFRFTFDIISHFPLFATISCLFSRQATCFRNNVENGDRTSFASGQIKFQRADALMPTCERERVNSIARERATRHETRTHVLMHARVRVSASSRMH